MKVEATAPGKVALLGEYAVLEGAPALAVAVDRRARARIETAAGGVCRVTAPEVGCRGTEFEMSPRGHVVWRGADDPARFALFSAVIERLALTVPNLRDFDAVLCTSGFFHSGAKLGLGSSAALTVALVSALLQFSKARLDPENSLGLMLDVHASLQGGGSGLDIATSFTGGLICYERASPLPRVSSIPWPPGLHLLCLWSGRPASTQQLLRAVADWRAREPEAYGAHIRRMAELARRGVDVAGAASADLLAGVVDAYADALESLGAACGIDIMTAEHAELRRLASKSGAAYKPSGAGGGDVGVAVAEDPSALQRLRLAASRAGYDAVDLAIDPAGLTCG
ncbi:phosphomevalonate kinase [soil metagenome]